MPATQAMADSVKKGFRGLSVVNAKVIWISGQKGLVGRSTNGGKSFVWRRIRFYGKMDFRTLQAFSRKKAMIATAGTPACVLRTSNGGKTWEEVFTSYDSAMFFDGIGFWNEKRGLIFGDPVKGRMFLMETLDGGETWSQIPFNDRPQLADGEAAFAASGTTIRTLPNGHVYIATGGVKSRLWHSRDYGHHWEVFETPMIQGKPSQGIFSMAFRDTLNGIIVGGDYLQPADTTQNCFVTGDGGRTWIRSVQPPGGYRSCVEFMDAGRMYGGTGYKCVTIGPTGMEESLDGGLHWTLKSTEPGNAVKDQNGVMAFVAGGSFAYRKELTTKRY
jgi:photosystem II stability/assembly factor-like uncharacterized protein